MEKIKLINIENHNGHLVVTSRQVAEDFGRRHSDIIEKINNLVDELQPTEKSARYFLPSEYKDAKGELRKEYLFTRDGFTLAVMGFTGAKALEWKLKYIDAFNKMEAAIMDPYRGLSPELKAIIQLDQKQQKVETRLDTLENDMPLFNIECKELQALVKKIGTKTLGGYKSQAYMDNSLRGKVYSDIQHQLKREFGIERYEAIKRSQLDTARRIVEGYKTPMILESEIIVANSQMSYRVDM